VAAARTHRCAAECKIARVARFEFKQDPPPADWVDRSTSLLNLTVRSLGLLLLLVGMFVALMTIVSAWSLYANPATIENFAHAVERGSHLDLTLAQVAGSDAPADAEIEPLPGPRPAAAPAQPVFRFSYFVAWLLAILLLLLIGRLAIAAVRTGGELALYDVQVKKLARELVEARSRG
jgi:hypothetical protein